MSETTLYRLVVGENANEGGHIVPLPGCRTVVGAKLRLRQKLDEYYGDGWGYIESKPCGYGSWTRESTK